MFVIILGFLLEVFSCDSGTVRLRLWNVGLEKVESENGEIVDNTHLFGMRLIVGRCFVGMWLVVRRCLVVGINLVEMDVGKGVGLEFVNLITYS